MKRHLECVPDIKISSDQVERAVNVVTPKILRKQMINIYNRVGALTRPARIGVGFPVTKPLSPNIGMGMELDVRTQIPTIHIDEKLLDETLTHIPDKLMHHHAARYFILSAAGHTLVKDAPFVAEHTKDGPHEMMIWAWKIAAGLSLQEMKMQPAVQEEVVGACYKVCYEREEEYSQDMVFYTHQAALYEVNPPKLKPVEPWVQGLAYPSSPEDLTRYLRPSTH